MDQKQPKFWQGFPRLSVFVKCLGIAVVISAALFFFLGLLFPNATTLFTVAGYLFALLIGIGWMAVLVLTIAKLHWFAKQERLREPEM